MIKTKNFTCGYLNNGNRYASVDQSIMATNNFITSNDNLLYVKSFYMTIQYLQIKEEYQFLFQKDNELEPQQIVDRQCYQIFKRDNNITNVYKYTLDNEKGTFRKVILSIPTENETFEDLNIEKITLSDGSIVQIKDNIFYTSLTNTNILNLKELKDVITKDTLRFEMHQDEDEDGNPKIDDNGNPIMVSTKYIRSQITYGEYSNKIKGKYFNDIILYFNNDKRYPIICSYFDDKEYRTFNFNIDSNNNQKIYSIQCHPNLIKSISGKTLDTQGRLMVTIIYEASD